MAGFVRMDSGRLLNEMLGGGASFPAVRGGGFSALRPMLVDVAERPDYFEMLVRPCERHLVRRRRPVASSCCSSSS